MKSAQVVESDQSNGVHEPELTSTQAVVVRDETQDLLKLAVERGADVGTIERLMVVRKELRAEAAKTAYDRAMKEFQSQCPVILKEKGVPDKSGKVAYKFSPLEAIEVQIKPHERANGFHHTFPDTLVEPGWMTAFCKVTHEMGHESISKVKYPIGTKTAIMSDTQQYAAAETFCKRRALTNAYGITIAGEDVDGQTGKLKPAGPSSMRPDTASAKELASQLWALLKPVRGTEQNWKAANQWCWDESVIADTDELPNLPAERFKEVIEAARKKVSK